jgi:hypothetical protein
VKSEKGQGYKAQVAFPSETCDLKPETFLSKHFLHPLKKTLFALYRLRFKIGSIL